tara:strand:- start:4512 stop:5363 length:852 start_codon:yes stop_codon:yes gene_type:complete
MSRVFRRPMFRKGGEVGGGIMTGVMRENYETGTKPSERINEAMKDFQQPAFDPLAQLLIQGGLRGLSETGGGSTLGNLAKAFQDPATQYFKDAQKRKDVEREITLAGVEADIGADLEQQKINAQADLAKLNRDFEAAQGDADRQNKIAVKIQDGKNKIAELQFKIDNPDADPAKKGVIPSPEARVLDLTKTFSESDNLAVAQNPNLTANKLVRFQVNASPEIQSKFKGFVNYGYDSSGKISRVEPKGQAGDIFYDPQTADFLILDNQGNTYRLDPLTYEAEER